MAPSRTAQVKKEKIFHPSSRKAGQLARTALRKGKLGNLASKRAQKKFTLLDLYRFYYEALPEQGVLTLPELHHVVRDIWLTRFDEELEQERATRRKGRPKSAKQIKLEEIKLREDEEYRTGFEVIDLTHPANIELFRKWDQKEVAYILLLRFIRITGAEPDVAVVSRPGNASSVGGE